MRFPPEEAKGTRAQIQTAKAGGTPRLAFFFSRGFALRPSQTSSYHTAVLAPRILLPVPRFVRFLLLPPHSSVSTAAPALPLRSRSRCGRIARRGDGGGRGPDPDAAAGEGESLRSRAVSLGAVSLSNFIGVSVTLVGLGAAFPEHLFVGGFPVRVSRKLVGLGLAVLVFTRDSGSRNAGGLRAQC